MEEGQVKEKEPKATVMKKEGGGSFKMFNRGHYYAYRSYVRDNESYSLLPLSDDAVFVDAMFYPDQGVLLLLTKLSKEKFQVVPKINSYGEVEKDPKARNREKAERVRLDSNYEHYLYELSDIQWFADSYIVNSDQFMAFVQDAKTKIEEQKKAVAEAMKKKGQAEPAMVEEKQN